MNERAQRLGFGCESKGAKSVESGLFKAWLNPFVIAQTYSVDLRRLNLLTLA